MSLKKALQRINIAKKTNAAELDLSRLDLKEIPLEISGLPQLTMLSLSDNQLTEIKGLEQLTQLKKLYLEGNRLTEIKGLEQLTQLAVLELGKNQITEIKGLERLTQLTRLNLSYNQLTEIKGLERLTQLISLNLDVNRLTEIKGLEQLTQLTKLDLSYNRLFEIKGLEQIQKLAILSLNNNFFTKTKGLELFPELIWLDLSDNRIIEITELEQLSQLTSLNLDNNRLTVFPAFLLKLNQPIYWGTNYRNNRINVVNNPFTDPSPEIIQQGNKALQEYFNQGRRTGTELINEAKLILLGDGRSGKTSLANRLLGKELPTEADRTQGVDIIIGEYSFLLANGNKFKINIWDFAGQDKYKTLHQLFYTDSSLYVMVAESGKNTTDFDDWFQTAELFGEGSPLILILNEFKDGIGTGSFDSNYWKTRFPALLKEVFTVNLSKEKTFTAEEHIRFLAQHLPHTQSAYPSNWAAIRRVLNERRNEQFITLKEYLKICSDNDLPEEESALVLSGVLHRVGDCLHYQKSELLRQYIILKNEWATDAVYKVLDDKIVAEEKCGFFNQSDLQRVWSIPEYKHMRPQLLELMMQFKLAYQLPGKQEYVTPPLLPPANPAGYGWESKDDLELYIDYDFLPKTLLTQFIVTRHADIAKGRTLVWRHGVVLEWEGEALAEIVKTKLQGKDAFRIRTRGNNRKEIMTVILKTFRELHADYKGIKYREKVPCTCDGCTNKRNEQYYFDFIDLQFRLEKRRYEVECPKSLEILNVLKLLENSFVFEEFKEGRGVQLRNSKVLNLFLASSNELATEREKIEIAISRKNDALRKKGFLIDLLIWEDGKHIGKTLRSQDNYNLEIKQCDVFAMLFYSKVGKYSLEEFKLAKSLFEEKAIPRILVFQKDTDLPKNLPKADADSRYDFLDQLNAIEHFPVLFQNTDQLTNELGGAIDKLLDDEGFVKGLKVE